MNRGSLKRQCIWVGLNEQVYQGMLKGSVYSIMVGLKEQFTRVSLKVQCIMISIKEECMQGRLKETLLFDFVSYSRVTLNVCEYRIRMRFTTSYNMFIARESRYF